jgi:hypothetical protein
MRGRLRSRGAGVYAVRTQLDRQGGWQGTVSWYQAGTPRQWTFMATAD